MTMAPQHLAFGAPLHPCRSWNHHGSVSKRTTFACMPAPTPSRLTSPKRTPQTGTIIVPGKFDAFHLGHQQLARVAATIGTPTLLSFSGMAEVLKWAPRASVVAPIDRDRILRSWAVSIGTYIDWKVLPFPQIQHLTPAQFIDMLVTNFKASGIVCGKDWKFGRRASGNVDTLLQLATERDLTVRVVQAVDCEDGSGVISSTRVRRDLASGNVENVNRLLGRPHRLVGYATSVEQGFVDCSRFINQVPGDGRYLAVVRVIGRSEPFRTVVTVERPATIDPMTPIALLDDPDAVLVRVEDAQHIYCADCEVYIDFEKHIV